MDMSFLKIFRIFGAVSNWAEKSLEDGKITIQETVDLAESVAEILGIPLEIDYAPPKVEKTTPMDNLNADLDAYGRPAGLIESEEAAQEADESEHIEGTPLATPRPGES